MSETATETANNPTEAATSTEAPGTTLVTTTEVPSTQQQQGQEQGTQPNAEGKSATEEKLATEGAPEKYDFKAPEGKEYDSALLDNFSEAAKDANLTQEAAQKLLDKVAPALASRQAEQIEAIKTEWVDATKADKEIGGEKLPENLGFAKKALDMFGTPELRKLLDDTGLGNNPEVIRAFVKAGKAISEDSFVTGAPNNKATLSAADVLYGTTKE